MSASVYRLHANMYSIFLSKALVRTDDKGDAWWARGQYLLPSTQHTFRSSVVTLKSTFIFILLMANQTFYTSGFDELVAPVAHRLATGDCIGQIRVRVGSAIFPRSRLQSGSCKGLTNASLHHYPFSYLPIVDMVRNCLSVYCCLFCLQRRNRGLAYQHGHCKLL